MVKTLRRPALALNTPLDLRPGTDLIALVLQRKGIAEADPRRRKVRVRRRGAPEVAPRRLVLPVVLKVAVILVDSKQQLLGWKSTPFGNFGLVETVVYSIQNSKSSSF